MINEQDLLRLKQLQQESQELRLRFSIHAQYEVIFLAESNAYDDQIVVVEADGIGGASVRFVEGNYPIDYLISGEALFKTEAEALALAENAIESGIDPHEISLEYSRRNSS